MNASMNTCEKAPMSAPSDIDLKFEYVSHLNHSFILFIGARRKNTSGIMTMETMAAPISMWRHPCIGVPRRRKRKKSISMAMLPMIAATISTFFGK